MVNTEWAKTRQEMLRNFYVARGCAASATTAKPIISGPNRQAMIDLLISSKTETPAGTAQQVSLGRRAT